MSGRYSDRFFGPDAPRPGRDVVAGNDVPPDEAPFASPPPPLPPDDRPWHQHRAARLALAAALLVGMAGGGLAWDGVRDRQAATAARAAVDLEITGTVLDMQSADDVSLGFMVHNGGPHPVTLLSVEPMDIRLPSTEALEPTEIEAGEPHRVVTHVGVDCAAGPMDAADAEERSDAVRMRVRTVDGAEQEVVRAATGLQPALRDWVLDSCEPIGEFAFGRLYPDTATVEIEGDTVLATTVLRGWREKLELYVTGAESTGSAFVVSLDQESALGEWGHGTAIVELVWRVADCDVARTADEGEMTARVLGHVGDSDDSFVTVPPTAVLAAELARLAARTCG